MRLKSLEIQGFKSFQDKTIVKFDKNITGVVGPNGCGKSNIVDAIRWVMGEQSAKHLRGKNMEDVIFAGSQNREPSSTASVELTFFTEGYQVPLPYSNQEEISICRKLYRSGESEYYINRQLVRLKDITDLFLGTGIGTKAYSIIEQGKVDRIISLKPEERRSIIEEAAGISKFKIRKETALRKMAATEQNLFRLNDILLELERQLVTLEKQSKKAQKYKLIKDELLDLDLKVASLDYKKMSETYQELLKIIQENDLQETDTAKVLQETENMIESERFQLLEFEKDVQSSQAKLFNLDNRLKLMESKLQTKKDSLVGLDKTILQNEYRTLELVRERDGTQNGIEQINEKKMFADLDAVAFSDQVDVLEKDLQALEVLSRDLFSTIETARLNHNKTQNRLSQIESEKLSLKDRLEDLKSKKQTSEEELHQLSQRHKDLEKLFKQSQEQLAEVKQLKLTLNEQTKSIEDHLKEKDAQLKTEERNLQTLKEDLLAKKSRLQSLEELEKNFEGYHEGTRHVLQRKSSGELSELATSVADIIETDSQYEGAVSAVLGERVQYVVVQNYQEGIACAQNLKTTDAGRGSFIPLDFSSVEKSANQRLMQEQQQGYFGLLAEHVSVKQGYETLKDFLFADVHVAESLTHAMDLWQQHKKSIVTFDGEMISEEGVLTGGSLKNTAAVLLKKKREMKDLRECVADLVKQVSAKEEIYQDLKHQIGKMRTEVEAIKSSSHKKDVNIAEQEKDIHHTQRELDNLNQRRGQITQNLFKNGEQIEQFSKKLADLQQEEAEKQSLCDDAAQILADKRAEEELYRTQLTQKQEELTKEKIKKAQALQQQDYFQKELDRLLTESLQLQRAFLAKQEEKRALIKNQIFLEDRIAHYQKYIEQLLNQKNECDQQYVTQKNQFEKLQASVFEKEAQIKKLRQEHNHVKDQINASSLKMTELRGQMERLSDQFMERYQLMLSEIYTQHLEVPEGFEFLQAKETVRDLRQKLMNLGSVNLAAIEEYEEIKNRFDFMRQQKQDLEDSLKKLQNVIEKINDATQERFQSTFEAVNEKFVRLFPKLFRGGQGLLKLTDPNNMLETGVEIIAQPPGKKMQSISLMSGGEKALTALVLIFSIFLIKPSPFCLLDEVDAPLDDVNVDRYSEIIHEMSQNSQFVMITHNKRTMQITNTLFGVTMQEPGVSQLVSVNMQ